MRYLSGKGYCLPGIWLEQVIAESGWSRLLRYLSGNGYGSISLEKVISISIWRRLFLYTYNKTISILVLQLTPTERTPYIKYNISAVTQ